LILLCSPRSAKSPYVAEEIRRFKVTGKGSRIFAIIIDGEPHAAGKPGRRAEEECLPRALLYCIGVDGQISDKPEPAEPLAADFREGKDGRENGSLKIIAGLLDVSLDDLVKREKKAERRRRMRSNLIASSMAILALVASGVGLIAWQQRERALDELRRAQRTESLRLVEVANARTELGDTSTASLLALHALPQRWSPIDRPVVGSAVDALVHAGTYNREMAWADTYEDRNYCGHRGQNDRLSIIKIMNDETVIRLSGSLSGNTIQLEPERQTVQGKVGITSDCRVLFFEDQPPRDWGTETVDARKIPYRG
jgi:hypothetical protein